MKNKILLISIILLYSCSFDNKSGIWQNENLSTEDKNNSFKEFRKLAITSDSLMKSSKLEIISNLKLKINRCKRMERCFTMIIIIYKILNI